MSCLACLVEPPELFDGEVAPLAEPFVVLLDEQRSGKADQGGVVRVDADDVAAPPDLAVDALQRWSSAASSSGRGKP